MSALLEGGEQERVEASFRRWAPAKVLLILGDEAGLKGEADEAGDVEDVEALH